MKLKVHKNGELSPGNYLLAFEWPFAEAMPGQFVMIRVDEGLDPLLRRPMSIAWQDGNTAAIIYKVVGRGTGILSGIKAGQMLDITGPFGNSFKPAGSNGHTILVGGGVGVAPLLFYARRNHGQNITAVIGGARKEDILSLNDFQEACSKVVVTTEDGSMGTGGVVTDVMDDLLKNGGEKIIACGPEGMLRAIDKMAIEKKLDGEIALEERMGCGFGVCLGCMVETDKGNERVCVEGPVFKTGTVKWR